MAGGLPGRPKAFDTWQAAGARCPTRTTSDGRSGRVAEDLGWPIPPRRPAQRVESGAGICHPPGFTGRTTGQFTFGCPPSLWIG